MNEARWTRYVRWLGVGIWRRALLVGLAGGSLAFRPGWGVLGYHHAFAMAPVMAVLGIAVGVDALAAARDNGGFRVLLGTLGRELAVLHAVAVAMALAVPLWQPACDPWGGLAFYGMGPVFSSVMGSVAGLVSGVWARRRFVALVLGGLPLLASTLIAGWRLHSEPVFFTFDPFGGWHIRSAYRETIAVGATYGWYRAYNVLAAAAALQWWWIGLDCETWRWRFSGVLRRSPKLLLAAVLTTSCAVGVGWHGARFGFWTDSQTLTTALPATYETEHFVLHYRPRSAVGRSIEAVSREHEFAWHRLENKLGRAPAQRVHSFLFDDKSHKRRVTGSAEDVAKSHLSQMFIGHGTYPNLVLHHELAHIFTGEPPGLLPRGRGPPAFVREGVATALAPRARNGLDLHDQVRVLEALGRRPDLVALVRSFRTQSSRRAYTVAGSFMQWLLDEEGIPPTLALFDNRGDFEDAFGVALPALQERWLAFLDERPPLPPDSVQALDGTFRHLSRSQRPCARFVADLEAETSRARRGGNYDDAARRLAELCELEPQQPHHFLHLARAEAMAGKVSDAQMRLEALTMNSGFSPGARASFEEAAGDLALWQGDLERAAARYEAAWQRPSPDRQRRWLAIKRLAADDPALAPLIVRYVGRFETGATETTTAVRRLDVATRIHQLPAHRALGAVLAAHILLDNQQPEASLPRFADAIADLDALGTPELRWWTRLGRLSALVQTGRYDQARRDLADLEDASRDSSGRQLELRYWRDRIDAFAE